MLSMLGKKKKKKDDLKYFFSFYPENELWHFMRNLNDMSKPIFLEK